MYFAQLDAVLTHIYLREVAPEEIVTELADINARHNDGIHRIAHKMATGTGKTPVIAMLILWQAANHRNPHGEDHRFARRFLIITPGITVRERLETSLLPERPGNDWQEFNLLPAGDQWEQALLGASIRITNYHQQEPQSTSASDPAGPPSNFWKAAKPHPPRKSLQNRTREAPRHGGPGHRRQVPDGTHHGHQR